MIQIINSMKKINDKCDFPELKFGKSLKDREFLDLFRKVINYAFYSLPEKKLDIMKCNLQDIESYTDNIFLYPQITKDIKENGLLTYVMAKTDDEMEESMELIKANISTITPLIKLEFKRNNADYSLDKNELKNILSSNVLLQFYFDNLKNFVQKFDEKIHNKEELRSHISNYLFKYNIYFCKLPKSIYAITIHTGNIYLNAKYIQEYFEYNMNKTKKEDDLIIIREKMVLNIKHEMNHALLREIDEEKKNNFFLKSHHANTKKKNLIFKDKYLKPRNYSETLNESGNYFDFLFYKGYYFDNLLKHEANFFLDVKNMEDEKIYNEKFSQMIKETQNSQEIINSINKFKKQDCSSRCFKSIILDD